MKRFTRAATLSVLVFAICWIVNSLIVPLDRVASLTSWVVAIAIAATAGAIVYLKSPSKQ